MYWRTNYLHYYYYYYYYHHHHHHHHYYYYRGADKSVARPGKKVTTATKDFDVPIIKIGGILVLFIYTTRLASNEIFSPSNKIHREVGPAKDLSAALYH